MYFLIGRGQNTSASLSSCANQHFKPSVKKNKNKLLSVLIKRKQKSCWGPATIAKVMHQWEMLNFSQLACLWTKACGGKNSTMSVTN